jgi:Fe-S-cluster containining protein
MCQVNLKKEAFEAIPFDEDLPSDKPQSLPVLNCDGCGACCMEMRSPPFILYIGDDGEFHAYDECDEEELHWLMTAPPQARVEYMQRVLVDEEVPSEAPCVWLDLETRRCRYYQHRPQICRDFDLGSDGCHRWRKQYPPEANR